MYLFQHHLSTSPCFTECFTFHYVSISTVCVLLLLFFFCQIYIPLCIYFNRRRHFHKPESLAIYIPLCIYFNLLAFAGIVWLVYLHSTMYLFQPQHIGLGKNKAVLFTFHYVSISTFCVVCHKYTIFIYIPLCIYFNLNFSN